MFKTGYCLYCNKKTKRLLKNFCCQNCKNKYEHDQFINKYCVPKEECKTCRGAGVISSRPGNIHPGGCIDCGGNGKKNVNSNY